MPGRASDPSSSSAASRALVLARTSGASWFEAHLQRLADLPAHGNRKLTCDKLVMGLLLSFFDPLARSLRTIEAHGDFGGRLTFGGRLALGSDLRRLAKSTTADALSVFNPRLLLPIIDDLKARCPGLCHDDPALHVLSQRIIAADGTYFNTFCDVAWALKHTKTNGKKQAQVRANVQLDVATWCPQVVTLSGDDGDGEAGAFARDLLPGVLYVVDRNFIAFPFLGGVLAAGSEFIVRTKTTAPTLEVITTLPLRAADLEAGVVSDEVVRLVGDMAKRVDLHKRTFRRVRIETINRAGKPETIELLTSLTDSLGVPAATIAAAYRQRWQIELFFKWLKTFANLDSLLSTTREGISFQLHIAVIAVLAMHVQTGRPVSLYTLAALAAVARGNQTLEEALEYIERREREKDLAKARQARKRAAKKLA